MSIELRKHRLEQLHDFIDRRFFEPSTRWRGLYIAIAFLAGMLGGCVVLVIVKVLAMRWAP